MQYSIGDKKLTLIEGDITRVAADAVANAANSGLHGGGGVDGAIHRAGGPAIMAELDEVRARIGRCATGDAVVTTAGRLPAKWVIHCVGPIYRDGRQGEPEKLASCYRRAIELADEKGARTLSLPSISTGIYGYPLEDAAAIAVGEVVSGLRREGCGVEEAIFVLFGRQAYDAHVQAAERVLESA